MKFGQKLVLLLHPSNIPELTLPQVPFMHLCPLGQNPSPESSEHARPKLILVSPGFWQVFISPPTGTQFLLPHWSSLSQTTPKPLPGWHKQSFPVTPSQSKSDFPDLYWHNCESHSIFLVQGVQGAFRQMRFPWSSEDIGVVPALTEDTYPSGQGVK